MKLENSPELVEAMDHFQKRAEKTIALEELMETSDIFRKVDLRDLKAVANRAKEYIGLAQARYDSGNISEHELLFHKCFAIESQVHELRWSNGAYEETLRPIAESMKQVELKYGLEDDEYWPLSEAPDEYKKLAAEYDAILEKKLLETFSEFGADDLRDLYVNYREKFDDLHNIGHMSIFLKDEKNKLMVLASIYEREAKASANAGAFFAASVMLASAIESRLIITCLDNEQKVRKALDNMGLTNKKLKSKNPLSWKLDILIQVCSEAGWIPIFDFGRFTYDGKAMLNFLRKVRNNVHPAVKLKSGLPPLS